jgi:ATP-dependent RNA circularization protein (DNA/RNA ligase family)
MKPILKYPRTSHLAGSAQQAGDEDLRIAAWSELAGRFVVIEEKLDGANAGVSFSEGDLMLQSRGHALSGGGRERQFDLFKRWAHWHQEVLRRVLGERYVMYGEWLYARHTIPYDWLPHFFLEFDVWDREAAEFLSTERRRTLLYGTPVVSVPVLHAGAITALEPLIGRSTASTSEQMEGLYLKVEEVGRVAARCKFVRPGFLQAVEASGEHWMDRPIEPNRLRPGVELFG